MDHPQTAQLTVDCCPFGVIQVFRLKVGTCNDLYKALEILFGLLCTLVPIQITNLP